MRLRKAIVVGILNATPDSFSDGGRFLDFNSALSQARTLVEQGADIIDVGGESTRPNAQPVSIAEELDRTTPVIEAIHREFPHLPLSIDTTKYEVARAALSAGASIVNDVSAFRLDSRLASLCKEYECRVILMHSRGSFSEMALYQHAVYNGDVVQTIIQELLESVNHALAAGVKKENIILDPGIGFAKTGEQSLQILRKLEAFAELDFPLMVGTSRKRFLGEILQGSGTSESSRPSEPSDRDYGTVASNVVSYLKGGEWFRVHNVAVTRQALDTVHAIQTSGL